MTISRLGQRRQVVIPKEICDELGLREGDFVEVGVSKGVAIVRPKKLVDPDDILTPEEERLVRKGETHLREMREDPFRGDVKPLKGKQWKGRYRKRIVEISPILLRTEKAYR